MIDETCKPQDSAIFITLLNFSMGMRSGRIFVASLESNPCSKHHTGLWGRLDFATAAIICRT